MKSRADGACRIARRLDQSAGFKLIEAIAAQRAVGWPLRYQNTHCLQLKQPFQQGLDHRNHLGYALLHGGIHAQVESPSARDHLQVLSSARAICQGSICLLAASFKAYLTLRIDEVVFGEMTHIGDFMIWVTSKP